MSIILDLEYTPLHTFSKNLVKIKYIQHIQKDLTDSKTKKLELKIQFLNQSYIFQLIAFWQVFIEDLAKHAFRQIENSEGSGILKTIAKQKFDESLGRFNTPNTKNIDLLFKDALGISKISNHWQSQELTRDEATSTLSTLLEARHQIAHEGKTLFPLSHQNNFEKMETLMRIAELTEHAVFEELKEALGHENQL
jgi:hypothetical protein